MKIIGDNPVKKKWQLYVSVDEQGKRKYLTGNYSCGYREEQPWIVQSEIRRGAVIEQVNNFVFQAILQVNNCYSTSSGALYKMFDIEDGSYFDITANDMLEVMKSVQNQQFALKNGGIEGVWTFEKKGSTIYLVSVKPQALDKDQELNLENALGDNDLSDILKL